MKKALARGSGPSGAPHSSRGGQAQYPNVKIVFWKGWLYVVPLPPHSVLSREKGWVLVLGVVKLYTVLPMANCTEQGPGSGNALKTGKGFT